MRKRVSTFLLTLVCTTMAMQGTSVSYARPHTATAHDSTAVKKASDDKDNKTEKVDKDKHKKGEPLSDYDKLVKKGGSAQKGLFTVRHIEDKWYFEVPQDKLGKLLLIVTRFTAVPAGFKYNIGEEINENVVYLEKHANVLWLRSYVNNVETPANSVISQSVEKATMNPIVASFPIIKDTGKHAKDHGWLIDVTNFYTQDNRITSFDSSDRGLLKIGSLAERPHGRRHHLFPSGEYRGPHPPHLCRHGRWHACC